MSRHVADAAGARFPGSRRFVGGGLSRDLLPLLPCVSTTIKTTTKHTWWRFILIGPQEEATLLVSWFPASVEHPALVWPVLLHRARHRCLVTVTHRLSRVSSCTPLLPSASSRGVPEPQGEPRWGLQQRTSTPRLPLLIRPQKEVAAPGVALVELATLVGAVFAHGEEDRVLTAVTHDGLAAAVHTATAATRWRSWLRGPGGDRGKGRSRI